MVDPRRQTRREVIGLLLVVGMLALGIAIFLLDEIRQSMLSTYELVAIFPEAKRLRPGSPVWIAGRVSGRVSTVELLPPSNDSTERVSVRLELPTDVQEILRSDTKMRLTTARLIGDPVVDLVPGTTGPALKDGDTLRLTPSTLTPAVLMAEFVVARASLDSLMRDAKLLKVRVDRRAVQLRRVQAQASQSGAELRELQRQMDTGQGTLGPMMSDPSWKAALERVQSNAAQIGQAVSTTQARVQTALGDSLRRESLMRDVRRLQAQIAALQLMASSPNGYFGRSQRDSALAKATHGAQAQLDSLITEAKANPLRFVF